MRFSKVVLLCLGFSLLFTGCNKKEENIIGSDVGTELIKELESSTNSKDLMVDSVEVNATEPIQFNDPDDNALSFSYKASDYIKLDYKNISIADIAEDKVTKSDVLAKINDDLIAHNLQEEELTDEVVAVISNQKFQTVKEYQKAVYDELSFLSSIKRREMLFQEIMLELLNIANINGYPECFNLDVSTETENIEDKAAMLGLPVEALKETEENGNQTSSGQQGRETEFKISMIIQYIAEQEGFNLLDADYDILNNELMARDGLDEISVLREYTKEERQNEALRIKVRDFLLENVALK